MADEKPKQDGAAAEEPKKGGGKLPLLIVGALMLLEGVGVWLVVSVLGSGPRQADAAEIQGLEQQDREAEVEVELVSDRFQNMQSGRPWGWTAEIYLKVRQKNKTKVDEIMARDAAEIRTGIGLIFRRAQDRYLREPGLETITRQLTSYVNEVFGTDADGMPIVDRVLVPTLKGTPEDI